MTRPIGDIAKTDPPLHVLEITSSHYPEHVHTVRQHCVIGGVIDSTPTGLRFWSADTWLAYPDPPDTVEKMLVPHHAYTSWRCFVADICPDCEHLYDLTSDCPCRVELVDEIGIMVADADSDYQREEELRDDD